MIRLNRNGLHEIFPTGRWYIDHDGIMFIEAEWWLSRYEGRQKTGTRSIIIHDKRKVWAGIFKGWEYEVTSKEVDEDVYEYVEQSFYEFEEYISELELVDYFECATYSSDKRLTP